MKQGVHFRTYLQQELVKRCERNTGYSLRSFARTLQISPSSLSRILRGERPLSPEMRERLALRLGLSPEAYNQMPITSRNQSSAHTGELLSFEEVTQDKFAMISDWYHYAILELPLLKDYQAKPAWIAKKLGITVSEANIALERLDRLKLLGKNNSNVSGDLKSAALRKLQKQVLNQAIDALENTPIEERDQSSMTMAVSSKKLGEAIDRITNFRRELCAFLQEDEDKDRIYQLSVSLFPVTSKNSQEKTK